jgi:hypothetical protein
MFLVSISIIIVFVLFFIGCWYIFTAILSIFFKPRDLILGISFVSTTILTLLSFFKLSVFFESSAAYYFGAIAGVSFQFVRQKKLQMLNGKNLRSKADVHRSQLRNYFLMLIIGGLVGSLIWISVLGLSLYMTRTAIRIM